MTTIWNPRPMLAMAFAIALLVNPCPAQSTPATDVGAAAAEQPPAQPDWYPLPTDQASYLDQLLDYWQSSSRQVRRCTCQFTRWEYDPTYCNIRNPQTNELNAYVVWRGLIRYAAPDKAQLETSETWKFKLDDNQQPALEKAGDDSLNLKWICDGKYIYDYDFSRREIKDLAIPAQYQGDGLINSPLPFLFGADRQSMLNRFWIRVITPSNSTDEYWLEAIPKRLDDARVYSRVQVIITRAEFLPKSMIVFAPNYDPKENPVSSAYLFENRQINSQLDGIKDFFGIFVRPNTPLGWTRIEPKPLGEDTTTAQRNEYLNDPNRK